MRDRIKEGQNALRKSFSEPKKSKKKKKSNNKSSAPKAVRQALIIKYFKKSTERKCWCCRQAIITVTNFEVGHNKAKSRGGTFHLNNLKPICLACNRSMSNNYTIEAFRKKFFAKPKKKGSKKKKTKKKTKKVKSKKKPKKKKSKKKSKK